MSGALDQGDSHVHESSIRGATEAAVDGLDPVVWFGPDSVCAASIFILPLFLASFLRLPRDSVNYHNML